MNCNLNFWSISEFRDFRDDLPIYKEMIAKNELDRIQISEGADLKAVLPFLKKEIFAEYPSIALRFFLYGNFDVEWIGDMNEIEKLYIEAYHNIFNLDKLAEFKNLKMLVLSTDFSKLDNLDFLKKLPETLEVLALESEYCKAPKLDLSPIAYFKNLNFLYIQNLEKNLDKVLPQLHELEKLRLRSVSKPKNLNCIAGLTKLKDITLQLCSFDDLSDLAHLKSVRYLQLWRVPKLTHLDFISTMQGLQYLFIETMNGVQKFPNIADLQKLRRVIITSCKNINDFSEVAKSQSIQEFSIQNCKQTDFTIFIPILQNTHIEKMGIGYEKVATQKQMLEFAQKHGRERLAVYQYPNFAQFEFE